MNFEPIDAFWHEYVLVNSAITGSGIWLLGTRPGKKIFPVVNQTKLSSVESLETNLSVI